MAFQPVRDSETGTVTINDKRPGALGAFVHSEIITAQETLEAEELHA